tara:strand:+ start:244 stop:645 length:402 start_codon:yes stop_codon:yes gene_type:complete
MSDKCFECDAPAECNHHVVPKSFGGTKTIPLCLICHGIIHCKDFLKMSELTKKGRAKALKNGVKFGRKPRITNAQRQNVRKLLKEGKTYAQITELTGISRAMIYLIKKPEKAKQFNQQHKLRLAKQRATFASF